MEKPAHSAGPFIPTPPVNVLLPLDPPERGGKGPVKPGSKNKAFYPTPSYPTPPHQVCYIQQVLML